MTGPDDIDALAGEYVLGTLDLAERRAVDARRQREPALEAAIVAWQNRLAPLNAALPDVPVDADLFPGVLAAIDQQEANPTVVALNRRLKRWRLTGGLAIAASLVFAGLFGANVLLQRQAPKNFVALLAKDEVSPAFIVSVDVSTRQLTIRPYVAERPQGKSYELWLVNARYDGPRSLGVVGEEPFTRSPKLAAYAPDVVETSVLAVTLEPEGGSPSGKPTGPVLFSGKLIQSTP